MEFSGSRELGPILADRLRLLIGKPPADSLTIPAPWHIRFKWPGPEVVFVLFYGIYLLYTIAGIILEYHVL